MTSVDKAAMVWSIAIVAVAIGFTATGQSITEVSQSEITSVDAEMEEGVEFGFGGILKGTVSGSKINTDAQALMNLVGGKLIGQQEIVIDEPDIDAMTLDFKNKMNRLVNQLEIVIDDSDKLQQQLGIIFDGPDTLMQLRIAVNDSYVLYQQLETISTDANSLQQHVIVLDGTDTLKGELETIAFGTFTLETKIVQSTQELNAVLAELDEELQSVGDDAQLSDVQMQNAVQKHQETLHTISNLGSIFHDMSKSVMQNIT